MSIARRSTSAIPISASRRRHRRRVLPAAATAGFRGAGAAVVAVGIGVGMGVGFLLPRPDFVPMPGYVRSPVYVRPPPNNIIFNNIHNTTVINNVINARPALGDLQSGRPECRGRSGGEEAGWPARPRPGGCRTGVAGGCRHARQLDPAGEGPSPAKRVRQARRCASASVAGR